MKKKFLLRYTAGRFAVKKKLLIIMLERRECVKINDKPYRHVDAQNAAHIIWVTKRPRFYDIKLGQNRFSNPENNSN